MVTRLDFLHSPFANLFWKCEVRVMLVGVGMMLAENALDQILESMSVGQCPVITNSLNLGHCCMW